MFSRQQQWYITQVSLSFPPVAVSPLWAAIHHGPAIWVHLQPTGPGQEYLSVCQSLSNDTRPEWPPALTNSAQVARSRVVLGLLPFLVLKCLTKGWKFVIRGSGVKRLTRHVASHCMTGPGNYSNPTNFHNLIGNLAKIPFLCLALSLRTEPAQSPPLVGPAPTSTDRRILHGKMISHGAERCRAHK